MPADNRRTSSDASSESSARLSRGELKRRLRTLEDRCKRRRKHRRRDRSLSHDKTRVKTRRSYRGDRQHSDVRHCVTTRQCRRQSSPADVRERAKSRRPRRSTSRSRSRSPHTGASVDHTSASELTRLEHSSDKTADSASRAEPEPDHTSRAETEPDSPILAI